jgi:integrase
MKAKRLPSGNWRVQIMIDGKRVSVTAPTEDEAVYEAIMLKTGKKEVKNTSPTIGKCIDDYIASKRNILSPTTVDGYERCKKNSLAELCDIHISDITQLDIQKHINKLALTKSPKTISNAHGLLVAVLNVYRPEFQVKTTLPKQQKKIKHLPDVRQVFKAIKGSEIELPCLLAMWCSLRMSEVRGVKKSDIKNNCLTVHNTIVTVNGKHIEKNTTKTIESTRELRLPKYILDLISALPQDQEYITILTGQAISKRLNRLLANNDVEGLSFHGLRHMNASIMVALGIPDKYAMERGGWSSDHIMKSVYQHTFTKEREAVDDKIDDFFNSIIETL